mgnify:CR=1 FL=1
MKNTLYLEVINSNRTIFSIVNVDGIDYKLEEKMEINLSFNEIEQEIGSKIVSLKIKKEYSEKVHNFEALKGDNYGFLFTFNGKTIDLIFNDNEEVKIKIGNDKIIEKNLESHIGIKRLLLINFSDDIPLYINNKNMTYDLMNLTNKQSIQVSVINLEQGILPYKEIIIENPYQKFIDLYEQYNKELEQCHLIF